ncbi:helix-turn-helix domain-containing protein [Rhodococcus sp. 3Y1]
MTSSVHRRSNRPGTRVRPRQGHRSHRDPSCPGTQRRGPTKAARALNYHPNTVVQRLDRIRTLLGQSWREDELSGCPWRRGSTNFGTWEPKRPEAASTTAPMVHDTTISTDRCVVSTWPGKHRPPTVKRSTEPLQEDDPTCL